MKNRGLLQKEVEKEKANARQLVENITSEKLKEIDEINRKIAEEDQKDNECEKKIEQIKKQIESKKYEMRDAQKKLDADYCV